MQEIGLRPKLRYKGSFYDLVKSKSELTTLKKGTSPPVVDEAQASRTIPLPTSIIEKIHQAHTTLTTSLNTQFHIPKQPELKKEEAVKMVPVSFETTMMLKLQS